MLKSVQPLCIYMHAKQIKRITFVVMNEMTTGTFVMFRVNGDMFIYQLFNMYNHLSAMRCLIIDSSKSNHND